jgi:hypothetical protein
MLSGVLIVITFFVFAVLIAAKKLSAMFALPVMSIIIALISRMPLMGDNGIVNAVLVSGTSYLQGTVFLILIACWLSQLMYNTGVTNTIIKKAAELGGDKPVVITALLLAACVFLFTSLFGTGAAMMVGTIVLPLLISVGVPQVKAINFFMTTLAIGFGINASNMAPILDITKVVPRDLLKAGIVIMVCGTLFLIWQVYTTFAKSGKKYAFAAPVNSTDMGEEGKFESQKNVSGIRGFLACMTPLLIVLLTMVFRIPPLVCFYAGVLWVFVMTFNFKYKKYMNMLTLSFYDACRDAAPPIGICLGIGMVLKAMTHPSTQEMLVPLMNAIMPSTTLALIIFMVVLAPLNLYRGPLSIFGLGSGLLVVMMATGKIPALVLAALFLTQMRWSNEACPTSTIIVWGSNFVGTDPVTAANKVFFPNWIVSAVALTAVTVLYMS